MSLVYGIPDCTGRFQLVCVDCLQPIPGTISLELAAQAGRNCADSGGVKCPDCRARSCPSCGSPAVDPNATADNPNKVRLCALCLLEIAASDVLV